MVFAEVNWLSLLETFGVAVAALMFLGWAGVKIAIWVAPRIDKLTDRLFSSLDKMEKMDDRVTHVEQRIETLWDFQLRRAKVEAVVQGVGRMNSPLVLNADAKSWLEGIAAELRSFYRRLGRTLTESQLAEEIERRWGDEIVKRVCIPHGLFQGTCLLLAMEVAKEGLNEESGEKSGVAVSVQ